jgi:hypothetical protein
MRYSLLLHHAEATADDIGQEAIEAAMAAFQVYAAALEEAGVLISTEVLQSAASTTTLTLRNGSAHVQDGPFADTKEQLGGTFVIDVPDLDAALAWAERCPAAEWGAIEIRPTATRFVNGKWLLPT